MEPGWQERVGAVLQATLPGERVCGYWLRTATVEDAEAGKAGTLDLVVASVSVLAHLQFLALPSPRGWRLVTRTQVWPLARVRSVATETLSAGAGGQEGLLVQIWPPEAEWEVELNPAGESPVDGSQAGRMLGAVRGSVLRIVVEPVEEEVAIARRDRQRAERGLLVTLAKAIHSGLSGE
ncbi:hypothetical protein N8J89_16160 [Crossiella sp. CA-258035]|uniref:hypothetical protein n=1 Tax=Crossiella sp. CA-258035 TaxID=2981138 RepID=UPI0024BCF5B3|nr:hypothetical protein [Crossiella sp. CA-258035]WHT22534.1 hypothetical protein N8J89_16160 [Crossiella sp. CA-258035]